VRKEKKENVIKQKAPLFFVNCPKLYGHHKKRLRM